MTADEWAGEEDYQQQRPKGWWPVIVVGLLALLVACFRLAAVVLNRACR